MIKRTLFLLLAITVMFETANSAEVVFEDDFESFDFTKWRHDITLSGGGNWEF